MGYISLGVKILHPLIYARLFKRSVKDIDSLIAGYKKYAILDNGELQEDPNGGTGLKWLYDNYNSIKFKNFEDKDSDSIMMSSLKNSINTLTREEIFIDKFLVMPLLYRDVLVDASGNESSDKINDLYKKLLQYKKIIEDSDQYMMMDVNTIKLNLQRVVLEIFDMISGKLYGKYGAQRKKAMGKAVDYSSRLVISAANYDGEYFHGHPVNIDAVGYPLSTVASTFTPFTAFNMYNFLLSMYESGKIVDKDGKIPSQVDFDSVYSQEVMEEFIIKYDSSWGERLKRLRVPGYEDQYIMLNGVDIKGEPYERYMTLIDLVYIGAYLGSTGKHMVTSRYPIQDTDGVFPAKVHVLSTDETMYLNIDGMEFKYYPDITKFIEEKKALDDIIKKEGLTETNLEKLSIFESRMTNRFNETLTMSNTRLQDINGDYDGDTTANRSVFSDEANEELDYYLNKSPKAIFNLRGENTKFIKREAVQTIYQMTIDPLDKPSGIKRKSKVVDRIVVNTLLNQPRNEITVSFIMKELRIGDFANRPAEYEYHDIIKLKKDDYPFIKEDTDTTLGRLIVNRVIYEGCLEATGYDYINKPMTKSVLQSSFTQIGDIFLRDDLELSIFKDMIERYEVFGLKMSPHVTPSYTYNMLDLDQSIKDRRSELLDKYKDELENVDLDALDKIEKELIDMVKEKYEDDQMMDFYRSGSNANIDANYKKYNLMYGGTPANTSGSEFIICTGNYTDGLKKSDIHKTDVSAIFGGYFRAKATAVGGYQGKISTQLLQSVKIDKKGTDCKTDVTIPIQVTDKNYKEYIDAFIMEAGAPKLLTYGNIKSYVGKTVRLRDPMGCKNQTICHKCAGDRYYKILKNDGPIDIGLILNKPFTELNQKSMKKTHSMTVKRYHIKDLNDFTVDIPIE
jgi:hypothetical protein